MKSHPNVNEWMNEWIAIEQTSGDRIANINRTRIAPDLETRFSKLITLSAFGLWIIIIIIVTTKKHVDCLWYRYLWASSRNIMFIYFSIIFYWALLHSLKKTTNHTTTTSCTQCTYTRTQYPLPFHIKQCAQVTMNDLSKQHHPFSIWFFVFDILCVVYVYQSKSQSHDAHTFIESSFSTIFRFFFFFQLL